MNEKMKNILLCVNTYIENKYINEINKKRDIKMQKKYIDDRRKRCNKALEYAEEIVNSSYVYKRR